MTGDSTALQRLRELRELGQVLGQSAGQEHKCTVPQTDFSEGSVGQQKPQESTEIGQVSHCPTPRPRDSGTVAEFPLKTGTLRGTVGGTALIPANLRDGLNRLRSMPAPRITQSEVWPEIIADALRLASEGWAARALGLGWNPLNLWGASPAAGGIADLEGLAVWLTGRRLLLLDAKSCLVANGPGQFAQFNVRPADGAVFLWELHRGTGR